MDKQKQVLLITYYWPPGGGSGVHRWLRFSKYFAENNCRLHVYSPSNAGWPVLDEALKKEIAPEIIEVKKSIFEPHRWLEKKKGQKKIGVGFVQDGESSLVQKLIIWIRGNLFIPDARVFWIKPSYRFLKKYLKQHPEITTIISSGPPHSMHVIGLKLKRKLKIRWIADFRDPWTQIDFYQDLKIGARADRRQKKLEKACLQEADEVITVSNACAEGLEQIAKREVKVITNGYDFPSFDEQDFPRDKEFTIAHFGSMPASRNPEVLWRVIAQLIDTHPEIKEKLRIKLVGSVDFTVFESLKKYGLQEHLDYQAMVTHAESIALQRKTQVLLLVANNSGNVKGILTGKFFEYLGARRPILAIGQSGSDLEDAVVNTNCGAFADFDDTEKMKSYLIQSFEGYKTGVLKSESRGLEVYTSANLAKRVCELV